MMSQYFILWDIPDILHEMSGKRKLDSIVLSGNRVVVIIYT